MNSLTPELKAYLYEWRAEIKSMCDEMRNTRRLPLSAGPCNPPALAAAIREPER
jgi:hypothetical protein